MNLDFNYVLAFATKKHEGQFRADGTTPYIEHPKLVAEIVRKYKKSSQMDELLAAALLHDTLEDTYTSYKELVDEFGEITASIVLELTTAPYYCRMLGKTQYLEKKMEDMSSYALFIKLADRLANLIDRAFLSKERKEYLYSSTSDIICYLKQNKQLTKSQTRLVEEIEKELQVFKTELGYNC